MFCFSGVSFVEGVDFPLCSELLANESTGGACVETEELRTIAAAVTSDHEYTQNEIDIMKEKAVVFRMNDGSIMIELFPEDAPNTVNNFLKLVESGYYDGVIFHRIIPGFMIQGGDPLTKNPEVDQRAWGTGGPGYNIDQEFNTLQHDRGVISMARSQHPDSASSQFFIMHDDVENLDGEYTAFGRLVPLGGSFKQLDTIAGLMRGEGDRPLDVVPATIIRAEIIDNFSPPPFAGPDRNISVTKEVKTAGGVAEVYFNQIHDVGFELPYRWEVVEGTGDMLSLVLEPGALEHNVKQQIESSGVTPQVMIFSMKRDPAWHGQGDVSVDYMSIKGGNEPNILQNYIFENGAGRKAHIIMTSQLLQSPTEDVQFRTFQIRFTNSETDYAIIYVHAAEWFRYEVNSFFHVVKTFEIEIDGKMQLIDFVTHPVFVQLMNEARAEYEPAPLPPVRVGGCLIATASYGSELAPQVQLLREIRDNTVLQTQSGASFMNGFNHFYYSFSPAVADYERENPVFKEAVKLTLTPLLASLTLLQYTDINSENEMLGYGIGLVLLNIGMYFVAPAVLIMKIRSFYKLQ